MNSLVICDRSEVLAIFHRFEFIGIRFHYELGAEFRYRSRR